MFNYNPAQEVVTLLNTNNIHISDTYYNYVYHNLRFNGSVKISEMLSTVQSYYSQQHYANSAYYPVDLAFRALNTPNDLAFITGASGRATQDAYNRARQNNHSIATFLNNCGFQIPRRHSSSGKKCINFIFVSSGFSLIKNLVRATPDVEEHTFYTNVINTYRKNNISQTEQESQTIVLKNIYNNTDEFEDNLTIITNKVPDLRQMMTMLLFVQAHYSGALINNKHYLNNIKTAIENNDERVPLKEKLRYYLTEFWEMELQVANNLLAPAHETITNSQTKSLDDAYLLYLKSLIAEAPTVFLEKLAERYNYDYKHKDEEKLNNAIACLKEYYQKIQELEHERCVLQRRLAELTDMSTEEIKEFWETIKLYKNITVESTSNTALILKIISPLTFFDEEEAKVVLNNPNSSAISNVKDACRENDFDYNVVKAVLFDIFVNKKYQIHTYTRLKVAINNSYSSQVLALTRYYTGSPTCILNDRIWQPHIMGYECYDAAKTKFHKAISEKNFEVAFGQLVGATQNIRISDSTVFSHLLYNLVGRHAAVPTIYDPETQQFMSFDILYMRKEEEIENFNKKVEEPTVDIPTVQPISEIEDTPTNLEWIEEAE